MIPCAAAIRDEAARLAEGFRALGAIPFDTGILQPAGPLLDLYGEDIRARAYVTRDPHRGEMMLRPDFTLPVVRRHMRGPAGAARYAYAGEVFRRQEDDPARPREYVQAGFEVLGDDDGDGGGASAAAGGGDAAARDAEVLATLRAACGGAGRATFGDIGLVTAAVRGLTTSERRRRQLLRHVWRPARFRALLASYAAPPAAWTDPPPSAAPEIGAREAAEVAERIEALRADAATPPVPSEEAEAMVALLALACPPAEAADALGALARALGGLATRLPVFATRLAALGEGLDLRDMGFEASHARSAMEYYDGVTFTITAPGLPPLATGGRYDALTRAVGGAEVPAVGGVVRPAALLAARG